MSQRLGFYTDTHIDKQVAIQLRNRGVQVVRCQDVGLADASDEVHLEYASQHGLALISKDADFETLHYLWMSQERQHSGIFLYRDRYKASIGKIVTLSYEYYQLVAEDGEFINDVHNQLIEVK